MFALLALVFAGVSGGALYNSGFWDTWADKKPAIVEEIKGELEGKVPEEARDMFANCTADVLIELATTYDCPRDDGTPFGPQLVNCLKAKHGSEVTQGFVGCIMQVQESLSTKP